MTTIRLVYCNAEFFLLSLRYPQMIEVMEIANVHLIYFSATYTTRKVVRLIGKHMGRPVSEHDITRRGPKEPITFEANDLVILGTPVYSGRIPVQAAKALQQFQGTNTPAIIVCVYGNRDYDDALLELKETVEAQGFHVVSAGAFIARHSIFPDVAADRPDDNDVGIIGNFADRSAGLLRRTPDVALLTGLEVKGNHPYREIKPIPLQPHGNHRCDRCGVCVKQCPVQAIPEQSPRRTIKDKCISCGRCIVVCPQNARHFGGIKYKIGSKKFFKAYSGYKEPTVAFAHPV